MKLDLRLVLPAALAAGALALPSTAGADSTGTCPDHFTPTFLFLQPDAAGKDKNGNLVVCHKDVPGQGDPTKDDNGFITSRINDPNPDDWADDLAP
jgi:hypothetical protein